jgi:hypothetical protein
MLQRTIGERSNHGFSTIAIAFLLLVLTFPLVIIAEATLVSARQASSNALGQENLRAVDGAMSDVISEVRLDPTAADTGGGCRGAPLQPSYNFDRPQLRPSQGVFVVQVRCSTQKMNGAGRVLDFEAYVGTIKFGESRVRYVDQLGANPEPGFEMLVCDWQLGRDTEPLAECPDVSAGPN